MIREGAEWAYLQDSVRQGRGATVEFVAEYGPQGVAARDVIHVAVMPSQGLTQIISTDAHFDQFESIMRLDPQDLFEIRSTER